MPYFYLFKRVVSQLIDAALFYIGFREYYDIVNADNPMAYDRLFNGVGELMQYIPIWIACSFVLELFTGYSVGKWVLGLQVFSIDGSNPGLRQVVARRVANWIDFYLTLGLGALGAVVLSPRRQRLGDRLAGTVVREVKPLSFL